MNPDIRWKQRFENLSKAHQRFTHAQSAYLKTPADELMIAALIQTFEFTFELAWKTIKDYLKYNGVDVKLPREVIKEAFAAAIIQDGQTWIEMMEDRNACAHTYDEAAIALITERIVHQYAPIIATLVQFFQNKLQD